MGPAGVEEQASHLGMRYFCTGWRCWLPKVGTSFAPWSSYIGLYKWVWSCDPYKWDSVQWAGIQSPMKSATDEHGGMNIHCRGAKHHGGCCRLNNGLLWGGLSSLVPQLPRITCGNHDVCDGNDRKDDDYYYNDDDGYGDDENNADHEDNGSYHQTNKNQKTWMWTWLCYDHDHVHAKMSLRANRSFDISTACFLLTCWHRDSTSCLKSGHCCLKKKTHILFTSRLVGCSTRGWIERIRCDE